MITTKKSGATNIPEAIEYTLLNLPLIFEDSNLFKEKLKENILLQAQGDPIEIKESSLVPILMLAFNTVSKVCPEVVYRFVTGEQIMVYNHQVKRALMPNGIFENFVDFKWKQTKDVDEIEKLNIDLDFIWEKTQGQGLLDRIKLSLDSINEQLRKTKKITLVGKSQPLVFLFAQYKAYEFADEIYYQETKESPLVRIN